MKWIAAIFLLFTLAGCSSDTGEEVVVSIAASLSEGMEEIAGSYTRESGVEVVINTGGSGALKKQVEQGAPVDFVFLASKRYTDELRDERFIEESEDLLLNSLAVIGSTRIEKLSDIEGLVAMGDPDFVPAGRYGRESLVDAGMWKIVEGNVLLTKDVRSALAYAQRGEVDFSIVYMTDAMSIEGIEVYEIEDETHSPIIYSAGVGRGSSRGRKFKTYLQENLQVFEKYGFKVKQDDIRSN